MLIAEKIKFQTLSRTQIFVALMTAALDFFHLGLIYPIFSELFSAQSTSFWSQAILYSFLVAAFPLGQFIGSPFIGKLSDRHGRRSLLLITLHITLSIAMLCCAVAYTNVFAYLSNHTTSERQGEVLGLGVSVQCLAEWLPLLSIGVFIAASPAIPMISGSIAALIGLVILLKH